MQTIHFMYTSSEVQPSVYLLLFFRLVGIYVYESYFDFGAAKEDALLSSLPERARIERKKARTNYDLELFYVSDEAGLKYVQEQKSVIRSSPVSLVVCKHDFMAQLKESANLPRVLEFSSANDAEPNPVADSGNLLKRIIKEMAIKDLISKAEEQDLQICRTIYQKNRIWKLSLEGRFFYADGGAKPQANRMRKQYSAAAEAIRMKMPDGKNWGDKSTLHIQYALLNLAYEGDLYCIRSKLPLIYTAESVAQVCMGLIEVSELSDWKNVFCLLLAQICDDLLSDYSPAYQYYLECCNEFNAYAYYRKGILLQEWSQNYERALDYYKSSVYIYPEYYRAWYRMGRCFMSLGRYDGALASFRNVKKVLNPRLEKEVLRSMEVEYLFKAQNQCAYICNKVFGELGQSVIENQTALKVWEMTKRSKFYEEIGYGKNQAKAIWRRVQNELSVKKICYEICKLADRLEDISLKSETIKDLEKCLEEQNG